MSTELNKIAGYSQFDAFPEASTTSVLDGTLLTRGLFSFYTSTDSNNPTLYLPSVGEPAIIFARSRESTAVFVDKAASLVLQLSANEGDIIMKTGPDNWAALQRDDTNVKPLQSATIT